MWRLSFNPTGPCHSKNFIEKWKIMALARHCCHVCPLGSSTCLNARDASDRSDSPHSLIAQNGDSSIQERRPGAQRGTVVLVHSLSTLQMISNFQLCTISQYCSAVSSLPIITACLKLWYWSLPPQSGFWGRLGRATSGVLSCVALASQERPHYHLR